MKALKLASKLQSLLPELTELVKAGDDITEREGRWYHEVVNGHVVNTAGETIEDMSGFINAHFLVKAANARPLFKELLEIIR